MNFLENLQLKYAQLNVAGKLVAIVSLITILFWLLGLLYDPITGWFGLPAGFMPAVLQPWSWFTYGFLHGGFLHLLFNMLVLYFTGQMLLNLFSGRQFLTLFFTGIVLGGFAFTLGSSLFPDFFADNFLVGASAGVYATLFFICSYMPDTEVRLFFILNVKLKYLAMVLVALDIIAIVTNTNAGGSLAHLAGSGLGYYAATRMKQGVDVLEGFASIGDGVVALFKSSPKNSRKSKMKTVYKNQGKATKTKSSSNHQQRIDGILDKISESGYESLSREEKDFLFKAGKD